VNPVGLIPKDKLTVVEKGWGKEIWIHNDSDYCGKILHFHKGMKLSFHYHRLKKETFYLFSGLLLVYYSWRDDLEQAEFKVLYPGDAFEVPPKLRHRMLALEESYLIEASTQHFDDDSIRIIKGD